VQAATSGIALQASVDAKADKNSPIFTGTPTAPTPASSDNSTKLATTAYVDAQVAAGAPEASSSSKGIIQLAGALGGTASSPTVPGLTLKEDLTNKSTAADLGALNASDDKYPSQKAVRTFVTDQISNATISDASLTNKGKLKLAGDLAGTAAEPLIATGAITSAKILDSTIVNADIASTTINLTQKVTGTLPVANGGTGLTALGTSLQVLRTNTSATALEFATISTGAAAGQVIQVLSATDSTGRNTTSGSYVTASNTLAVTITPSSSSNKIFVITTTQGQGDGAIFGYATIFRGATNLGPSQGFIRMDVDDLQPVAMSFLDSPATTSAITYQFYFRVGTGSGTVTINNDDNRGVLTCFEIQG
jgi:hypothetical protein